MITLDPPSVAIIAVGVVLGVMIAATASFILGARWERKNHP